MLIKLLGASFMYVNSCMLSLAPMLCLVYVLGYACTQTPNARAVCLCVHLYFGGAPSLQAVGCAFSSLLYEIWV